MFIFKLIGAALVFLGTIAGFMLLLLPFVPSLGGREYSLWWFFGICFIGGFILFAFGSQETPLESLFKTSGSILLILGLMAAAAFFFNIADLIQAVKGTTSLWILFLICTVIGSVAVLKSKDISKELKKNVD
jgi:hypothetical protein